MHTSPTKEAQQALKLSPLHSQERVSRQFPYHSEFVCMYTSPTKEVQQALKLFLKISPCIHKKGLASNCLIFKVSLYAHKPNQGGPTSSKAIFKHSPLHSQDRVSRQFPYHAEFVCMHTSPTKEVQQALKLFLKILLCIHKNGLADTCLTIQSFFVCTQAPPRRPNKL